MIDLTCTRKDDCPAERHEAGCPALDQPAPVVLSEPVTDPDTGIVYEPEPPEPVPLRVIQGDDTWRGQLTEVRVTSSTGGQKGTKAERYDLIPHEPLRQLAILYGRGAEKYEPRNWERGYPWSLSYAAALRHMTAYWRGEDVDPEMGVPHLICAAFHLLGLTEFLTTHPEFDDRPGRPDATA